MEFIRWKKYRVYRQEKVMRFIMKFKKSCQNKQSKWIKWLTHYQKKQHKMGEKNSKTKTLTFGDWKFGVRTSTCTWQGGEGKYHTNQGTRATTTQRKTMSRAGLVGTWRSMTKRGATMWKEWGNNTRRMI